MASTGDSMNPLDQPDDLGSAEQPYAQEPLEIEDDAPRRAASARFIVESEVGSEAAMRDAMDPANQSLAEALRLSFRVLQAVILVLIVLFLVSGFQTVDEGQSGVRTVWGKIAAEDGSEALMPGLKFSAFPYPIGEFVLFRSENRSVDLNNEFAPQVRTTALTREQMIERADLRSPLMPGRDGSVLTRDGDVAHLELSAQYEISQSGVGEFVRNVNDNDRSRDADRLVKLAMERAAIQVAATSSLQELIEQTDDVRLRIQQGAQEVLDGLHCGIALRQVQVQHAYAPLAIEKSLGDLQAARVDAAKKIDEARQKANETLNKIGGRNYPELVSLIQEYQKAQERHDEAQSTALLASINEKLDNNDGGVSQIIQSAKAYQSQIDSTLGNEYRRFASFLPAYRSNPQLVIGQLWLDTYSKIVDQPDAELVSVPDSLRSLTIGINGSADVQEYRRRAELERKQNAVNAEGFDPMRPYIERARDIHFGMPGRQLEVGKDNKVKGYGSP